jgi:hypothetical protein
MVDYSLGKIYKIVCDTTGKVYYGSTCEPTLSRRLAHHTSNFKRHIAGKKESNISSFEVLAGENYNIVLVEKLACNDKMELLQRERFYIENNVCVNRNIPSRTFREWKESNVEHEKNYRVENKVKLAEQRRKWAENNKEQMKTLHQNWYNNNKNKINEQRKVWKDNNTDFFKTKTCECGGSYTSNHLARHIKTNKHKVFITARKIDLEL